MSVTPVVEVAMMQGAAQGGVRCLPSWQEVRDSLQRSDYTTKQKRIMQKEWGINMERRPTHLGANSENQASGPDANTVPGNEETEQERMKP